MDGRLIVRIVVLLLLTPGAFPACGEREDPARAAFRARLTEDGPLSSAELARFRDEIAKAIEGRTFLKQGPVAQPLDAEEQVIVFGMLTEPAGMYDEGLRTEGEKTFRVLNAPGRSTNSEIEAVRRLWVDVETFLPRRFEFAHAFPGHGEYAFDLQSKR